MMASPDNSQGEGLVLVEPNEHGLHTNDGAATSVNHAPRDTVVNIGAYVPREDRRAYSKEGCAKVNHSTVQNAYKYIAKDMLQ